MAGPSDIMGKRIIIAGEVNTGKTTLAKVDDGGPCAGPAFRRAWPSSTWPPTSPPRSPGEGASRESAGGSCPLAKSVAYFAGPVRRAQADVENEGEALLVAAENRATIDRLLEGYRASGRDVLFINDVSIYLQAGWASDSCCSRWSLPRPSSRTATTAGRLGQRHTVHA